jgi:hypothetical protein
VRPTHPISQAIIANELQALDQAIRILMRAEAALEPLARNPSPVASQLARELADKAFAAVDRIDFELKFGE